MALLTLWATASSNGLPLMPQAESGGKLKMLWGPTLRPVVVSLGSRVVRVRASDFKEEVRVFDCEHVPISMALSHILILSNYGIVI
jgi:hypothetical protein